MVFIMFNKTLLKRVIYILSFLLFLFLLNIYLPISKYNKMYIKYAPDYRKKYQYLLENYELINDNYTFIPAEVINLSFMKINDLFLINKGLNNNVKENSYVVDEKGLVGVVRKSFNNYSIVQLKSSNNLKIAVEINDCYGTLVNKYNNSYVDDLINCTNVKVNDPVFTSKYSVSSSNILIGYVKKIKNNKIYIKFLSNPYTTKFVGVVYDEY